MANLFAPIPSNSYSQNQNKQDPIEYAENMMKRSGGDAKAAFYLGCEEQGVDPNVIISQIQSMAHPEQKIKEMLFNNPKARDLLSLFSMKK